MNAVLMCQIRCSFVCLPARNRSFPLVKTASSSSAIRTSMPPHSGTTDFTLSSMEWQVSSKSS